MKDNEQDDITGRNHPGSHANEPVKFLTASSIRGDKVFSNTGEHLGKIMDVMLNLSNGRIEYVIVEVGGFIGVYAKYFAVPFEVLTVNADRHAFVLKESKESFRNRPGLNKNHWPATDSHTQYPRYYGGFMRPSAATDD